MKAVLAVIFLCGTVHAQYVNPGKYLETPPPANFCESKHDRKQISQTEIFKITQFTKVSMKFTLGLRAITERTTPLFFRLYARQNGLEFFRSEFNVEVSRTSREYEFTIPTVDFSRSMVEALENREYASIVLDFLDTEGCVVRTMGYQLPKNPFAY